MKAALYARVSTSDKGQNPEVQLSELRAHCEKRGWQTTEFVDVGISGSKESRPQLDAMLTECRRRKYDAVIVYRYDRFARSLKQLVNALTEFNELGIAFVSIHEAVDTTTSVGKLIFGIFASIAEFERDLIRERVKSGLNHAKAKGKQLGRKRIEIPASVIEQAKSYRKHGMPWSVISDELHIPVTSIRRALKTQ